MLDVVAAFAQNIFVVVPAVFQRRRNGLVGKDPVAVDDVEIVFAVLQKDAEGLWRIFPDPIWIAFAAADAYCATSVLSDYSEDGRLDTFFQLLRAGDEGVQDLWDDYLDKLAILINNTCMMFDSDVVIGGYMGEHMEEYMDDLKRRVYKRNSFDRSRDFVRLCRVRKEPVSVGAALYYIEDFISGI